MTYRDESEALRARLQNLEEELAEARERIKKAERAKSGGHRLWALGVALVLGGIGGWAVAKYATKLAALARHEEPTFAQSQDPEAQHAANLERWGEGVTDHVAWIDATPLKPLQAFEPESHLPWMTDLARTWSPDARLVGIEIHGLIANGTLDVSSSSTGSSVTYAFASRARDTASIELLKVSDKPLIWSMIELWVKNGGLRAELGSRGYGNLDTTPIMFGCKLSQIIEMWNAKGLPYRKTYDISLSPHDKDFRWVSRNWGVPEISVDCKP
jgi:hypothetical protein